MRFRFHDLDGRRPAAPFAAPAAKPRVALAAIPRVAFAAILLAAALAAPLTAAAQDMTPALRIVTRADSLVYVYHNQRSRTGLGFNLYRKLRADSVFSRLDVQTVRSVQNGTAFQMALGGDLMLQIQDDLRRLNPDGALLKLRADPVAAALLSFIYPEVADALGRRALDEEAPIGQTASYRLEWVDEIGQPTGEIIEETVSLVPTEPASPSGLSATNSERQVTLSWHYPRSTRQADDKVIRFDAYRLAPGERDPQLLNPDVILRNNSVDIFSYTFDVPGTGQTERFFVSAVDITGQSSRSSSFLDFEVEDMVAPETLFEVAALALSGGAMEVTWPISVDFDAAGYHVYRGRSVDGDFLRMNEVLLPLLQTTFADSTVRSNTSYFFKVSAVDSSGNESPLSNAAMALAEDHRPPGVPQELAASYQEDGSVLVNWQDPSPPRDLKSYLVLRRQLGQLGARSRTFAQVNRDDFTATELRDPGEAGRGFLEGAYYEYLVLAADSSRNFSDSAFVVLQIPDRTAPEAPGELRVTNDGGFRLNVSWQATSSRDATAYHLYRKETSRSDSLIARMAVETRAFRDGGVVPGRLYTYGVSAIDSLGNESIRTEGEPVLMRDFAPPLSVRNVYARFTGNGVVVRWEPSTAGDLVGYRVFRSTIATGVYVPISGEPAVDSGTVDTRFADASGIAGAWYRVTAVDSSGNESRPSTPSQAITDNGTEGR